MDRIEIKKGGKFLETAKELSDLIKKLPLSNADNDALIAAILKHTDAGRQEAYVQGIGDILNTDLIQRLAEYEADNEDILS